MVHSKAMYFHSGSSSAATSASQPLSLDLLNHEHNLVNGSAYYGHLVRAVHLPHILS